MQHFQQPGSGFLFAPWLAPGVALGVLGLVLLTTMCMPWEDDEVVRTSYLPVVDRIPQCDRDWPELLVLSVDRRGRIWLRDEIVDDLRETLARYEERNRTQPEVLIRPHRECRWAAVSRIVREVSKAGLPTVVLAARTAEFSGWEQNLFLHLADVQWKYGAIDEYEGDVPEQARIVLRSLDPARAHRESARITALRERGEVEPVFELAFPDDANAQMVYAVLVHYAQPDGWMKAAVRKKTEDTSPAPANRAK